MPPDLHETLGLVAGLLHPAHDPWWIIGSAAVVLQGAIDTVADIDVLLSVADARRLLPTLGLDAMPGNASPLFRSTIFARWTRDPLPVEFMAGFAVHTPTGWRDIRPATRERVRVGAASLYVPARAELRDLLLAFGRPKDLARAALLAALD